MVFLAANEGEILCWATLLTPASGKKIWSLKWLKKIWVHEQNWYSYFAASCLLLFLNSLEHGSNSYFCQYGQEYFSDHKSRCLRNSMLWRAQMLKAWTGFCTGMLPWVGQGDKWLWWVFCTGDREMSRVELLQLRIHVENETPTWLLGLHKRGCSVWSTSWDIRGKANWEVKLMNFVFSKIVRWKWYFFLCKYYEGRVSKH